MELNDTKYNQKRLAVAKFLGELYNYRLIDSSVVFKVFFFLRVSSSIFLFICFLQLSGFVFRFDFRY